MMNTKFWFRVVQGALIGLGSVLPGISGGVLSVVFGVYQPIMELLSDPLPAMKKHARLLLPIILGMVAGFVGVARLLGFVLNRYPQASVCLFVGLILGMLPSLFREAGEKGKEKGCYLAMGITFTIVLVLLVTLKMISVDITPGFGWYLFCGFCLALSVIAPGMSFSTLLMPLGLYTPFVDGIGSLDMTVLIPGGIGALVTVLLLARAVTALLEKHYSVVFHGIIGIVMAATLVIVPLEGFTGGFRDAAVNGGCLLAGAAAAFLLDKFNQSVEII